jgi:hypothetical protein
MSSATHLRPVPDVSTRWCPTCQEYLLEPVLGGLGKLGRCIGCGFSGPLVRPERVRHLPCLRSSVDGGGVWPHR